MNLAKLLLLIALPGAHAAESKSICEILAKGAHRGIQYASISGSAQGYMLYNFLGMFELRFHFLENGVQMSLFSASHRAQHAAMRKVLDAVLTHEFGDAYRAKLAPREGSDTGLHSWIDVQTTPQLKKRIARIMGVLRDMPQVRSKPWVDWKVGSNELRAIELYVARNFPQVPESQMVRRVKELLPYFVNTLNSTEKLFVDASLIEAIEPKTDTFYDNLFTFLYGEAVSSAEVRRSLALRFRDFLSLSVRDGKYEPLPVWNEDEVVPPIEMLSSVVPAEVVENNRLKGNDLWFAGGSRRTAPPVWSPPLPEPITLAELQLQRDSDETDLPFADLHLPNPIRQKLYALPIEFAFQISNYSAKQLVQDYGLTRDEMIYLMDELNVHGIDLYFDYEWDRSNMRLRKTAPEYYRHRHTPRVNLLTKFLELDPPTGSKK